MPFIARWYGIIRIKLKFYGPFCDDSYGKSLSRRLLRLHYTIKDFVVGYIASVHSSANQIRENRYQNKNVASRDLKYPIGFF